MTKALKKITQKVQFLFFMSLGIGLASLGLESFLIPNHFIDGGVTGLAMLSAQYFNQPLPIMILLINLPFLMFGFKRFPLSFAIKSCLSICCLSLVLHYVTFPTLTEDAILAAVFGGVFLGAGIGFAIRSHGVLDGTEILAISLNERFYLNVGDIILVFNTIIFSLGAMHLGIELTLYSLMAYFAASKTADFIIHGFDEHIGIYIVSTKSETIKQHVIQELQTTLTIFEGRGAYANQQQDILFCVITQFEKHKLKQLVYDIDPSAFLISYKISYSKGGQTKESKLPQTKRFPKKQTN